MMNGCFGRKWPEPPFKGIPERLFKKSYLSRFNSVNNFDSPLNNSQAQAKFKGEATEVQLEELLTSQCWNSRANLWNSCGRRMFSFVELTGLLLQLLSDKQRRIQLHSSRHQILGGFCRKSRGNGCGRIRFSRRVKWKCWFNLNVNERPVKFIPGMYLHFPFTFNYRKMS